MKRTVTVAIDDFSLSSLEDVSSTGETTPSVLLVQALLYYLAERDSGRPGWPCSHPSEEGTSAIELNVERSAWEAFSLEADRQRVSVDQLLQHAALYYLADRDSGRLAQKILENLEIPES